MDYSLTFINISLVKLEVPTEITFPFYFNPPSIILVFRNQQCYSLLLVPGWSYQYPATSSLPGRIPILSSPSCYMSSKQPYLATNTKVVGLHILHLLKTSRLSLSEYNLARNQDLMEERLVLLILLCVYERLSFNGLEFLLWEFSQTVLYHSIRIYGRLKITTKRRRNIKVQPE